MEKKAGIIIYLLTVLFMLNACVPRLPGLGDADGRFFSSDSEAGVNALSDEAKNSGEQDALKNNLSEGNNLTNNAMEADTPTNSESEHNTQTNNEIQNNTAAENGEQSNVALGNGNLADGHATEMQKVKALWAEAQLNRMTTEEKIGQLIVCRLPESATDVTDAAVVLVNQYYVGGFTLFSENVQMAEQVKSLTEGLQTLADIPLMIAIDEEGGRVTRVGKLYEEAVASAYKIGQTNNPDAAYEMGYTLGERLKSLGINTDFAPVADIWSNDANTVIGDRAFGKDAETVAVMVENAVRGFKEAGVLSVIKHFPGHGDTAEDSHLQIAVYPYVQERYDSFEAIPFMRGIAAGADGVMVGHIATPEMQNNTAVLPWMEPWREAGRLPATFSDYWMRDILRGQMGFDGLIVSDALEMKALTESFSGAQIAVGTFMAGADILLIPSSPTLAFDALVSAFNDGTLTEERLNESVRRILIAKAGFAA